MALNNQLPLNVSDRGKGSLSDILPDLQDLIPSDQGLGFREFSCRRGSFGTSGPAVVQGLRQIIQRGANSLCSFSEGAQDQSQSEAPSATLHSSTSSLFGPLPALDLHSGVSGQGAQQDIPSVSDLPDTNGTTHKLSKPQTTATEAPTTQNHAADFLQCAHVLQASQALQCQPGLSRDIWQHLLPVAPSAQQYQQNSLAQQSPQSPQSHQTLEIPTCIPPDSVLARPVPKAQPQPAAQVAAQQPAIGSLPTLPQKVQDLQALVKQGVKRNVEGGSKADDPARVVDSSMADSGHTTSGTSDRQGLAAEMRSGSDAFGPNVSSCGRPARTPRQQEQNKQAQQRYRERRKMKVVEMESQVCTMQQQLSELKNVLKQNVALQDKALALEQQLAEKAKEVEHSAANASKAEDEATAVPTAEGLEDLKMDLQSQIMKLEQCVEQHQLRMVDVSGATLGKGVLEGLADSVSTCVKICHQAQAEGISTIDMLTRDRSALAAFAAPSQEARWSHAIKEVRLDEMQRNQLIAWHQSHMKQLQASFAARQQVNQKIQETTQMGAWHYTGKPGEEWLSKLAAEGYTSTAQANLALRRDLHILRESLKKEAKLVQQYNIVVMSRILTPVQAAILLVNSWPSYCDCLAFTNILVAQSQSTVK